MDRLKGRRAALGVALLLTVLVSVVVIQAYYSPTGGALVRSGAVSVTQPRIAFGYNGQSGYQFALDNSSTQTWYQSYPVNVSGSVGGTYAILLINASDLKSSLIVSLFDDGNLLASKSIQISSLVDTRVPLSELDQVALVSLPVLETHMSEGGTATVAIQADGPIFIATFHGEGAADARAATGGVTKSLPPRSSVLGFSILAYAVVIQ
jgi:hypothetical protein